MRNMLMRKQPNIPNKKKRENNNEKHALMTMVNVETMGIEVIEGIVVVVEAEVEEVAVAIAETVKATVKIEVIEISHTSNMTIEIEEVVIMVTDTTGKHNSNKRSKRKQRKYSQDPLDNDLCSLTQRSQQPRNKLRLTKNKKKNQEQYLKLPNNKKNHKSEKLLTINLMQVKVLHTPTPTQREINIKVKNPDSRKATINQRTSNEEKMTMVNKMSSIMNKNNNSKRTTEANHTIKTSNIIPKVKTSTDSKERITRHNNQLSNMEQAEAAEEVLTEITITRVKDNIPIPSHTKVVKKGIEAVAEEEVVEEEVMITEEMVRTHTQTKNMTALPNVS